MNAEELERRIESLMKDAVAHALAEDRARREMNDQEAAGFEIYKEAAALVEDIIEEARVGEKP